MDWLDGELCFRQAPRSLTAARSPRRIAWASCRSLSRRPDVVRIPFDDAASVFQAATQVQECRAGLTVVQTRGLPIGH
eukprot:2783684-Alexandrium_andersonii.AAC.1